MPPFICLASNMVKLSSLVRKILFEGQQPLGLNHLAVLPFRSIMMGLSTGLLVRYHCPTRMEKSNQVLLYDGLHSSASPSIRRQLSDCYYLFKDDHQNLSCKYVSIPPQTDGFSCGCRAIAILIDRVRGARGDLTRSLWLGGDSCRAASCHGERLHRLAPAWGAADKRVLHSECHLPGKSRRLGATGVVPLELERAECESG